MREWSAVTAGLTIATARALPGYWRAAACVGGVVGLLALVAVPYGGVPLPPNAGFLPAFGALTFLTDLLTAVVLLWQSVAAQDRATARLGAAYLFSACTIVPHLLAFPQVFAPVPIIGGSASAVWLWCVWHGGFALLVCWHAASAGARAGAVRLFPLLAGVGFGVLGCTLIATVGLPHLPVILEGGSYARLNSTGIGPGILIVNVVALGLVLARLRGRTVLSVWLAVAMVAATADCALTLWGAGRFTLGWYLARGLSITTGMSVLVALLTELLRLFDRIAAANRRLEVLALTDPLTRIGNRRAFDAALVAEWRRAQRERTALAVLAIDIDLFKTFNDAYGHPAGDACLLRVAAAIRGVTFRAGDVTARVGGEEFSVLLPGSDAAAGQRIAGQVHAAVAALGLRHTANPTGAVTVSIGVAANPPRRPGTDGAALAAAADRALYRAKESGRNRTCLAEPAGVGVAVGASGGLRRSGQRAVGRAHKGGVEAGEGVGVCAGEDGLSGGGVERVP